MSGPPRNPFKGLLPYSADDAALLFGRERLVARLLARLVDSTVVCLVGASGSGKTSLLHAGLVPALRRGALPGSTAWSIVTVTPGDAPPRVPTTGTADVLVVDQLEELLTCVETPEHRQAFVDRTLALADHGTRLILAVRSDLWADCAALGGLGELLTSSSVLVGPLTEPEVGLVVREGARRGGLVGAEETLVEAVVEDVRGQVGALPLLSTALARAWERRQDGRLTLEGYRAAGGLAGAVGDSADEAWAALSNPERIAARRILVRLAGDGSGGPTRRHAPVTELAPDDDSASATALAALVTARLVVVAETGATVSHEALFSAWPRLAEWLAEDAAGRRVRARLTPAALDWTREGRRHADLLRGPRLVEALDWADANPDKLIAVERQFLAASAQARDQSAAQQKRITRRLRRLAGTVTVLLIAALVSTALAVHASRQANNEATTAIARRLAEQALLETRPDLALLLAAQAAQMHKDPDTQGDLLATLFRTARALRITHLPNRPEFLALSSDGSQLAVSDNLGTVWLIDPATLIPTQTLVAPTGYPAEDLAFTAGNRHLASVELSQDHASIDLRAVSTGHLIASTPIPDGWALSAAPDAHRIAVGSYAGTWLWTPGRSPTHLSIDSEPTAFSRDGQTFAVADDRGGTAIYDADTGRILRQLPRARSWPVAALSPDARTLVTAQRGGGLTVWDVATGTAEQQLSGDGTDVNQLAFNASGQILVSGNGGGTVTVWDLETGRARERFSAGGGPVSVAVSADARTLYTVDQDGTLAAWDLTDTRGFDTTTPVPPQSDPPEDAAAFSRNGQRLVLALRKQLVICDGATLHVQHSVPLPSPGLAVALDPSGRRAAVRTAAGLTLVDLATGTLLAQTALPDPGADSAPNAIDWSPDGRQIAVADPVHRQLLLLNPSTLALQRRIPMPDSMRQVAFASAGRLLAVSLLGGNIAVLNTDSGSMRIVAVHVDPVDAPAVAFLDRDTAAIGGRDGQVRLWNLATGQPLSDPIPSVPGAVATLSADARTQTVVVSGDDGSVRLLDSKTRTTVGTEISPPNNTTVLALVDPVRPRLLLMPAGAPPTVVGLNRTDWLNRACSLLTKPLDREELRPYLGNRSYTAACPPS